MDTVAVTSHRNAEIGCCKMDGKGGIDSSIDRWLERDVDSIRRAESAIGGTAQISDGWTESSIGCRRTTGLVN
jgi:hypothetical protein